MSEGVTLSTLIHRRVDQCRAGTNPKTVCRVQSGWVVLGDVQFLEGYSLLLPDPVVGDLNQLQGDLRTTFLYEMSLIGDALLDVTEAYRINYEILGNSEPALHAHVFPRYENEPQDHRKGPAWYYDRKNARRFDAQRDSPLMARIRRYLEKAGAVLGA